jgi:single-stranded-DNA-specific exonuclease
VIGIVASRVAEHFSRPAILIAVNAQTATGQGSGRSFGGFDLHAGLTACATHLVSYGGHQAAAGLRIGHDRIDAFRDDFCRYVSEKHTPSSRDTELQVDAEVRLADLTPRAVKELELLNPFGHANPRPLFAASGIELAEPPRKMGEGERHLSLRLRQHGTTLRAVAFTRAEWADQIVAVKGPIAISFAPVLNTFRGAANVELHLKDWKADVRSESPRVPMRVS